MQILCVVEHFVCLILEDVARYVFKNKAGKMPTSKRKMNRKQWKQPEIIGKRQNDRLGFIRECYLMNGIWHEDAKCT